MISSEQARRRGHGADKAEGLLKKHRGEDREELEAGLTALREFIDAARAAHSEALTAEAYPKETEFEPWMAHFRLVNGPFVEIDAWRREMKSLVDRARKHDAMVGKAISSLSKRPNRKAFLGGVKALREGMLSGRSGELQSVLERLAEEPPKGVKPEEIEEYRSLVSSREKSTHEGIENAARITAGIPRPVSVVHLHRDDQRDDRDDVDLEKQGDDEP